MLRTTTLVAVAALALSPAFAQEEPAEPQAEEETTQSPAQEPAADAPAEEAPAEGEDSEAPAVEAPAPEEGAEATAEETAPEEETEVPAEETAPDAPAEGATEAPAEEGEAAEAPAEESESAEAAAEDGEAAEAPAEAEAPEEGEAEHAEAAGGHEEGGGGHDEAHVTDYDFSFEGPFGSYDQMQLQRGLQVYTEICASCHGLRYVPFRSLHDENGPGLPEDQVRAYAAFYEVFDPELDDFRTAIPTDHFPASAMETAPDLSLMAKARAGFHGPYGLGINQFFKGMGGPEYIVSLLTGYTGEQREEAGAILYENTAFPGGWISMPPPLYGDDVEYEDGAPTDLVSVSKDVAAFLMWTAEPKLAARKQAGFTAVFLLTILAVLLYLTNKRIWAPIKHGSRKTPAE